MEQFANTDALTGVSSRRAFLGSLEAELVRARRHGENLSLLMLDIDHFKRINDGYGHPAGDAALQAFAATCARLLRAHDLFGRLGGEEFAIALPHTSVEGARCVAEKIRLATAESAITTPAGELTLTVSIGVASAQAQPDNVDHLIARADRALYEAKQNGRNQVRVSGETQPGCETADVTPA